MDTQEKEIEQQINEGFNPENSKKHKLFQFKYHNQNPKFPATAKSQTNVGGTQNNKISLRNTSNNFKTLKRAESTTDNFFPQGQLRSQMGSRNSVQEGGSNKKFTKGDGIEMLARGTVDSFKKFEPIGRNLQSYQQQRKIGQKKSINGDQPQQQLQHRTNFGVYTQNNNKIQGVHRANSQSHGFKHQNNFMKTQTEGFGNKQKAFTYFNPSKQQQQNLLQNSSQKNTSVHNNNNNNDNNSSEITTNNNINSEKNNGNSNASTNNTNPAVRNSTNSVGNFNFKKSSSNINNNNNNTENNTHNNNSDTYNSTSNSNFTKKKLTDARNKASMYSDNVVKRQAQFAIQEKEEEEQFLELCNALKTLIIEQ